MYGELSLSQQLKVASTVNVTRQAAAHSFRRARNQERWASLWAMITGRRNHLLDLDDVEKETAVQSRHYSGVHSIPLHLIRGSEGRSLDFDAAFRPLKEHNSHRWIGIAAARLDGVTLPPVNLVQVGSSYFVRDGNHRVSVAKALGETAIEAEVTVWQQPH